MAPKQYPDRTLETALRAANLQVLCAWQLPGPKDTMIAWLECLLVDGFPVIVQTFKEGGWEAFTAAKTNNVDETVADVIARCSAKTKVDAVLKGLVP